MGGRRHWRYSETADQIALTSLVDLAQARGSKSFDKLYREVAALIV